MKRIFALFLAIMLVFFVGCSSDLNSEISNIKSNPIEITQLNNYDLIFTSIYENYLYAFATDKKSVEYSEQDIDFLNDYYLVKVDLLNNNMTDVNISENTDLSEYSGMIVDKDSVVIYDTTTEKALNFDGEFNFLKKSDYIINSSNNLLEGSFVVDETFNVKEFGAIYNVRESNGYNFNAVVFNDDKNTLYLSNSYFDECLAYYSKSILGCSYNNTSSLSIGVYDYNDGVCSNQCDIDCDFAQGSSVTPVNSALSSKYAFVNAMCYNGTDGTTENHCYYWQYDLAVENTNLVLDTYDEKTLKQHNCDIIKEINDTYGLNVFIDYKLENMFDFEITYNSNPLKVYNVLMQLKAFLRLLPDDFVNEMYKDFLCVENSYKGFNIYLVNEINDNKVSLSDKSSDKLIAVFSSENFVYSSLPHEFMCLIKARIDDYFQNNDTDIYNQWKNLNPKGFSYSSNQEYNDEFLEYFVSENSLTSIDEEFAEIFTLLFCDQNLDTQPIWLSENTIIKNKASFLCDLIRQSYPCVNNSSTQVWEKWLS